MRRLALVLLMAAAGCDEALPVGPSLSYATLLFPTYSPSQTRPDVYASVTLIVPDVPGVVTISGSMAGNQPWMVDNYLLVNGHDICTGDCFGPYVPATDRLVGPLGRQRIKPIMLAGFPKGQLVTFSLVSHEGHSASDAIYVTVK
jgi:hypothetical protein